MLGLREPQVLNRFVILLLRAHALLAKAGHAIVGAARVLQPRLRLDQRPLHLQRLGIQIQLPQGQFRFQRLHLRPVGAELKDFRHRKCRFDLCQNLPRGHLVAYARQSSVGRREESARDRRTDHGGRALRRLDACRNDEMFDERAPLHSTQQHLHLPLLLHQKGNHVSWFLAGR
ncbi:MAG: hypothetical protein HY763_06195 [Planctomycetes bacterium]|nr:hypothetical protein [Planctomycetota bacterium]